MADKTSNPKLVFIIGCTGSGKGALGRELAMRTGGEIISLDSMKVYRRMDIGTAKPSADTRRIVPHHLVDVAEPSEDFSVAQYLEQTHRTVQKVHLSGKPIFVVGGTPLYLRALTAGLFDGPGADHDIRDRLQREARESGSAGLFARLGKVDPQASERIHPNDLRRIVRALEVFELTGKPISAFQEQWDRPQSRYEYTIFGIRRDREDQNGRTNQRVRRMMAAGLVDEVQTLLDESKPLSTTARQAVGYAEVIRHLRGEISLEDAVELIKIHTRRLAKGQRTWFKRFVETRWIDLEPEATVEHVANEVMERRKESWPT